MNEFNNEQNPLLSKLLDNFPKIIEKYNIAYEKLIQKQSNTNFSGNLANIYLMSIYEVVGELISDPMKLMEFQTEIVKGQLNVMENVMAKSLGVACKVPEKIEEFIKKDNRFKDTAWESNPVFSYYKNGYFNFVEKVNDFLEKYPFKDELKAKKLKFFTKLYLEAVAPSNCIYTNPEILRALWETGGDNLLKGLDNLIKDLEDNSSVFTLTTDNKNAFKIGVNLACTDGDVIYQNSLLQLIYYKPKKAKTFANPILLIPAWINKFYILDLKQENSFVNWLLDQGFEVFMISWVNPTKRNEDLNFEDYLQKGILETIDFIRDNFKTKKVSIVGYCLGGTITAVALAYLAQQRKDYVASATFLTTLLDFEEAGDLSLFIDDQVLELLESHIHSKGFLDGSEMRLYFNLIRANDMIWPFYINNYLLGKDPFPFDILYWNSDSTRLPAGMHCYYLRSLYKDNLLVKKEVELLGAKIDLNKIKVPAYFLSTVFDHISPWKSTFKNLNHIDGRFVLSSSGHVAGVVNHPSAIKYNYWVNDQKENDPDIWLENAQKNDGSWWLDWLEWVKSHSGELKEPLKFKGEVIEKAPGSYVLVR